MRLQDYAVCLARSTCRTLLLSVPGWLGGAVYAIPNHTHSVLVVLSCPRRSAPSPPLCSGGMIFTFYKADGKAVGASLVEEDKLDLAKELVAKAKVCVPVYHVLTLLVNMPRGACCHAAASSTSGGCWSRKAALRLAGRHSVAWACPACLPGVASVPGRLALPVHNIFPNASHCLAPSNACCCARCLGCRPRALSSSCPPTWWLPTSLPPMPRPRWWTSTASPTAGW